MFPFKKIISKRNFIKILLANFYFSILPSYSLSLNKLKRIRFYYNNKKHKLRIVLDTSEKINYDILKSINSKTFKMSLNKITIDNDFKNPKIDKDLKRNLKISNNNNNLTFLLDSHNTFKYKVFTLLPKDKYDHRLVIDLFFLKSFISDAKKNKKNLFKSNKLIIAIDAGHGGKDPGAIGKNGTKEKDIVLSISKKLYSLLKKEKNIKPLLIRSKDNFITLRQRISKARAYKSDLFISIHADAARNKKAKGCSAYVLSQRGASTEAAKWLANKENSADLIGGVRINNKDNTLAEVILDMSQSASIEISIKAANEILLSLKKVSVLHSKNIEQAGFVVLKSPDIPSILVETGFLSNYKEEKKLRSKKFQHEIANAIKKGILSTIKKGII